MRYETILYDVQERVALVTLNRPQYRNAQSRLLLEELDAALAQADKDREVGVIVVRGAGEHFSAGHDLGTPEEKADAEARPIEAGIRGRYEHSHELFVDFSLRWRNLSKPTVAVVEGYCIFGGWMIASAMDIIYAAEDAMFLGSNFQYFTIPWDMHPRKAKELLYESRFIDGVEAAKLELVNRVFPADVLMDEAMAYATRVAQNDPFQLRMIKLAVNQAQDAQGFQGHINAAHAYHLLSATGEGDPGFALKKVGKRRPMVQRAHENYERRKANKEDS
ncbi:MAG: enoyl-CoA hydratase [Gammaproteobacteria bacterium]|nr:enoyl-CoA hydratase [Gammaproteobacteria bacterium]|tara:strand:- start:562 stop:1392 length:831 start_codon:yes stop_codon:yes gene_type:complete